MFFAQIILNSFISGTHILLLAWALYLIHTATRAIHPAAGAIAMAGGYGYYHISSASAPVWISVLGGITIAMVLQLLSFFLLYRFFSEDKRFIALLGSLAIGTAIESAIALSFGSSGRFLSENILPTFDFFWLRITFVGIWTLVIGGVVVLAVIVCMHLLPYGRILRAIAGHRETAESLGIHERYVQIIVFVIVGIICGAVGILKGLQETITPTGGLMPIITAFLALIVGGVNDFRGIVLASYLLVLVPNIAISIGYRGMYISSSWSLVLVFMLTLILLIVRPKGLFSLSIRNS